VRRIAAPLHGQRFLLPGWSSLPRAERLAWTADEDATPDGPLLADLAWCACDGRRTVAEIAALVRLETGREAGAFVERFLDRAERLGLLDREPPGGREREDPR
jgi:hypothetical protein